ncbi:trehalose-6-phosphate synthase [Lichenihabitans sp. PAMC28606]|uniref:alpha,alpha-trehalose-phosphate synthase (UDP-forming) n=1 Tax=Lichenihabitans sp. PAMC28606 TaxID=2880932 RepID=UPI001D0B9C88|nr:trehalose-6-phosphate synthase [Lichenihabitans sp. PAMC28606]UDL95002.1 trehalose-6-phosphate synthase [Lichenihabitans sp. PAMC28606]
MSRLVIVSNRVVVPEPGKPPPPGGLAVAVHAALKDREGLWFGWSGKVDDGPNVEPVVAVRDKITYVVTDLSTADYQEYYNGFANRVLWPILHYRVDLAEFNRSDLTGYLRVNGLFADQLAKLLEPDDIIWVHDYHLIPLARELRQRGFNNPIGFFLHIPCPPPDLLFTIPRQEQSLGVLSHYDLVGFQTENDRANYGRYLAMSKATVSRDGLAYSVDGRVTRIGAFPVGIETREYAGLAVEAEDSPFANEVRDSLSGRKLFLGVDRLDYSKGIIHRLEAFGHFLENEPEWSNRVTLLQITPKSREEIPEYHDMSRAVNELVGGLNGRLGEAAWTPVRYINRSYSRPALAGIFRQSAAALVTPLRDGMNLVAKEFVAAQNPNDPGVLILSQFAGAAAELDAALIVNPHETEGMAAAMKQALEMPLDERRDRHALMYASIEKYNIDWWAETFLAKLADTRRSFLIGQLRSLFN